MWSTMTFVAPNVEWVSTSMISINNCSWNPFTGTNGIIVKRTMILGKKAKKKLKAKEEALVVIAPFVMPR